MAEGTDLATIYGFVKTGMSNTDADVKLALSGLSSGSTRTVQDMVKLQYTMSVFTITAQTVSSVMKEMSDAMKSVIQKMS
ncbi:MAG: EscF/YscF/HrpA family type III secretion system needle major subunit [Lacisediminimonas sp.]|nr:EscF/YscF/HrpA family type III secretion system needle major subunit [Lacisediminimonas sp.]